MGAEPSEFASADPAAETRLPRRRTPIWLALALTPAVIALPAFGAAVMYAASEEPVEWSLVRGGTIAAAAMCAVGWIGLAILRIAGRAGRRPQPGALAGAVEIDDPELIRSLLAHQDVACSTCGYNLRGLASPSCPECREPIRLHLQGADATRPLVWPARLVVAACGLHGITGAIGLYQLATYWFAESLGSMPGVILVYAAVPVGCVLGALLTSCAVAVWIRSEDTDSRAHARWRALRLGVWVLAGLSVLDLCAWVAQWLL